MNLVADKGSNIAKHQDDRVEKMSDKSPLRNRRTNIQKQVVNGVHLGENICNGAFTKSHGAKLTFKFNGSSFFIIAKQVFKRSPNLLSGPPLFKNHRE